MTHIHTKSAVETVRQRRPRISPLNQRRWRNFKSNRRGYWSLWLFLLLFGLSLFREREAHTGPFSHHRRLPA